MLAHPDKCSLPGAQKVHSPPCTADALAQARFMTLTGLLHAERLPLLTSMHEPLNQMYQSIES